MSSINQATRKVICIGDLHGNLSEAVSLWNQLEEKIGIEERRKASVIFLGDYCDRGPNTRGVLDWLCNLEETRSKEIDSGGTHFICGNHDYAFAAYLGVSISSIPLSSEERDATVPLEYKKNGRSAYYSSVSVPGGMSYQGRRWGGSFIYDAEKTFESYGVKFSPTSLVENRAQLLKQVPSRHKRFLQNLKWVHEETVSFSPGRVICVHAGLEKKKPSEIQLEGLRRRDFRNPNIHDKRVKEGDRLPAFSSRSSVFGMPNDLIGQAILVSGHHGRFFRGEKDCDRERWIIDASAGQPSNQTPIQALVLPDRILVNHCAVEERTTIHPGMNSGLSDELKRKMEKKMMMMTEGNTSDAQTPDKLCKFGCGRVAKGGYGSCGWKCPNKPKKRSDYDTVKKAARTIVATTVPEPVPSTGSAVVELKKSSTKETKTWFAFITAVLACILAVLYFQFSGLLF
jgi:hypothetical protein